jgi:hypothetical protein
MRVVILRPPAISGREAVQQIEDRVLAGRGPDRTGLHPRTEEMAVALCRDRGAMAVPKSGDRSALSRRFDSCRLSGSDGSPFGTWEDRVPYVPPHLPSLAGRNRSTGGRSAETHATRARLHNNGSIWKCLGLGKTQSQSANRATPVEKVCHSAGLHSINKGNCEAVPLIGQFWTVTTREQQFPVTL